MKVLLVSQDFYPMKGGIATYLIQIIKNYFSRDKPKVLIPNNITKRKNFPEIKFPIEKIKFEPFVLPSKRSNKQFLKKLREFKPDLVLFGYIRSHPEIMREYKKINSSVKWGIVCHAKEIFLDEAIVKRTNDKGKQKGYTKKEVREYKNILNSADFLLCVSNFTKSLLKKQGIKNKNIFVISPLLNKIPKRNKISKKEFSILSVGRLIKRKGQKLVLESLIELKKIIPEIKYSIVGDGPEMDKLKKFVEQNNLSKQVKFYGEISEKKLEGIYSKSNIFVLPTKFIKPNDMEGFGIVFLEANFYGMPVIGGNNGGVREAIKNNKTGFQINPNSKKELIKKIVFFYENREKLKKMGDSGRNRVKNNYYNKKNRNFVNYLRKS